MAAILPPQPSRKSLVFSTLLFAVPLTLAQGMTIFFSAWTSSATPWLVGTSICYILSGGLCTLKTTRSLDESTGTNWGCLSGLLTGLFSSLLGLCAVALCIIWYIHGQILSVSTQPSPCHVHTTPLSCPSPMLSLIFFAFGTLIFLIGNVGFVFLALLAGTLVGSLKVRHGHSVETVGTERNHCYSMHEVSPG